MKLLRLRDILLPGRAIRAADQKDCNSGGRDCFIVVHRPSSVAGVTGVSGTLGAGVESPFCSLLFRFFPGVSIVESAAGLYVFTSLRKRNDSATGKENALRLALLLCLFLWGVGVRGAQVKSFFFLE